MWEELIKVALSEYGVLVAVLGFAVWRERQRANTANDRVTELTDLVINVIPENTAAITVLSTKFDQREEVRNAKNS